MEVFFMKKSISLLLILAMMLSFSAVAFAASSPSTQPSAESDVFQPIPAPKDDINLDGIALPKDVSVDKDTSGVDDSDIVIEKLAKCSAAMKDEARQELAALKRSSLKCDCGFGVWSKSGKTSSCTIKLSEKDVNGGEIYVNGNVIEPELKDGYYIFTVTLPAVVLIVHK